MNKGHQGWIRDEKAVDAVMDNLPYPVFSDVWSPIKGSGKGKTVLLYDIIRKVNGGKFPNRKQTVGDLLLDRMISKKYKMLKLGIGCTQVTEK
jgi:hypothetical protein